jgi:hypothetical protein
MLPLLLTWGRTQEKVGRWIGSTMMEITAAVIVDGQREASSKIIGAVQS